MDKITVVANELQPGEASSPAIDAVHELWVSWCDGCAMPTWRNVDMMQIPSNLLPFTIVLDVIESPSDFTYRYWGRGLASIHSQEMTGASVDEIRPVELAKIARANYEDVVKRKAPVRTVNQYTVRKKVDSEDFIIRLPISSGEDVEKIMCIIDTDVSGRNVLSYLSDISSNHPASGSTSR